MNMKKYDEKDPPNNDISDLDELIKKFFGNIRMFPVDSNQKPHHHSISYRFGTGMGKAEIRVDGEKVNEEEMKNFMDYMGSNFNIKPTRVTLGSNNGISTFDVRDIEIPENPVPQAEEYLDTYFEIEHDGNTRIVTIELPGVNKDHISVTQNGNTVTIIGENQYTAYKAEFQLDFTFKKKLISGKNSIYQIRFIK
jgi:HSP20 family molecular chaperone IbpA